ncbi:MAG: hypothetical protein AAB364_01720 [Patescibacteria group bacterium]
MKRFLFVLCVFACLLPVSAQADIEIRHAVLSSGAMTSAGPAFHLLCQPITGVSTGGGLTVWHGSEFLFRAMTQCLSGDVNCDGAIDGLDVQAFVLAKIYGQGTPSGLWASELDIPTFVSLLLN